MLQATHQSSQSLQEPSGQKSPEAAASVARLQECPAAQGKGERLTGVSFLFAAWLEGVSFGYMCPPEISPRRVHATSSFLRVFSESRAGSSCAGLASTPRSPVMAHPGWLLGAGWHRLAFLSGRLSCLHLLGAAFPDFWGQTAPPLLAPSKPQLPSKPTVMSKSLQFLQKQLKSRDSIFLSSSPNLTLETESHPVNVYSIHSSNSSCFLQDQISLVAD